jgi:RND family efflux transporter MFP subunit
MKAEGVQRTGLMRFGPAGPFKWGKPAILFIALVIAAAVGYTAYQMISGPAKAVTTVTASAQVTRGSVSSTTTAAGSVVATKSAKLTFGSTGKVTSVSVAVGDSVKKGQELGKIDTTDLQVALAQAQSSLRTAQINLQVAQNGGTAEAKAAAQAAYDSAVAAYNETAKGATDSEIKTAEQTLASAQTAYSNAVSALATVQANPDPDGIQAKQIALQQAQEKVTAATISRNGTCGDNANTAACKSGDASIGAAQTSLNQAALELQVAQSKQGSALSSAQKDVASAKAALESAQANLAKVNAGATEAELLAAKKTVDSAKAALTKAQGSTSDQIALLQESVTQAEAAVKQAELNLNNATIVAPFDGTVGSVGANVGEQATSGMAMFTLVDPTAVRVDVNVPEADLAKVAVGKSATITFDALPDQTFTGKVVAVAPSATVSSGVSSYLTSLTIDTKGKIVPPGLSASATIIADQKDNVLVVPAKYIKTVGNAKTVQVMNAAGAIETRNVQVGITGDNGVEITGGLNEGDKVVVVSSNGTTATTGTTSQQRGGTNMGGVGVIMGGGGPPR